MSKARGIDLRHAWTKTPVPPQSWAELSDEERNLLVNRSLDAEIRCHCTETSKEGVVMLELRGIYTASERGHILRRIEAHLKTDLHSGLMVYIKSVADRNSLRHLRGIQINA